MVSESVEVLNMTGIDVDCAGTFCKVAMSYPCHIEFAYDTDNRANAKSMLSVLGASVKYKDTIEIICDGPGEDEAIVALCDLIKKDFQI